MNVVDKMNDYIEFNVCYPVQSGYIELYLEVFYPFTRVHLCLNNNIDSTNFIENYGRLWDLIYSGSKESVIASLPSR